MSEDRPFIYIHMMTALDGKITGPFFDTESAKIVGKEYEWTSETYKPDASLIGRKTVDENFTNFEVPQVDENDKECPDGDFIAKDHLNLYLVTVDPSGKIAWKENTLQYDVRPPAHLIEALTEKATPQYRMYLRKKNISYVIAGKTEIDWKLLMKKLKSLFNINVLSVQGGGTINWSLLNEGIVDELSITHTPVADGSNDTVTLFEQSPYFPKGTPVEFNLKAVEKLGAGGLWLRYTPKYVKKEEKERPYLGPFDIGTPNVDLAQYFTGQSYRKLLSDNGCKISNITFEPGCRNNWHIHHNQPQILLCTSGYGWYQEEGKDAQPLKPGDVVNIPAGVKHWHGARKDTWFAHLSIYPPAQNTKTEWLEPVSDDHYNSLVYK